MAAPQFSLTSPAFNDGGWMPSEYTIEGQGGNPPLEWRNPPDGTRSFALEMIDYDIPGGRGFVHWVLYDIPANESRLHAAEAAGKTGRNGVRRREYYPPCPVNGAHGYTFRIFALDCEALNPRKDDQKSIRQAVDDHLLGTAQLVGRYRCQKMNDRQALFENLKMYVRPRR